MRRLRKWLRSKPNARLEQEVAFPEESFELAYDLEQNERKLRQLFPNCSDLVFRNVRLNAKTECLVVYLTTLVDEQVIEEHILKPLLASSESLKPYPEDRISVGKIERTKQGQELVRQLLHGYTAILTSMNEQAWLVRTNGGKQRSLEEPSSEPVIRGPRDGFIENISTNMGLLRSRLKTSTLRMEALTVGRLTQTQVVISYLEGIAKQAVVDEVRERIARIRIDGIIDSSYIEEFIEDCPYSPFPQVHSTERPDVVAAELLEGRVAILVENTPFVLVVPMTLMTGVQASEDYYIRWPIATFVRWIRFLFISIAIFAPPLYVAITTFHQEMIPTNLVISIASSREAVPFPALIEAMLMEIIFEALREAGIRLPKQIGQAVSIVGALVIGQAAVLAGIISAPVVIIVSITGIAAFTIPRYSFANGIRLLRFPMLFLAGTLGLYGIVLGFIAILLHVTSLRSFGVPYFTPISFGSIKDIFIRAPIWAKTLRPQIAGSEPSYREPEGQQPSPRRGKRP
ncbi:spore germination protein [Paenibacillus koleovorans]|uniref:spore germination protein n=1 Tax=Paenibacillus koleovorans TaxID=121608 RepID=UPI000FD8FA89|nr:spore germination protein [Paenibacillus koleovorans]